jgi:uncharacterized protein involved in tolerance to divalent cations
MINGSIFTKLEIDVMQVNEILEAVELAHKYKLPAIVVHPGLSSDAIIARLRAGGKFKIITPIDWPKGETFGVNKLRGVTMDTLETDGFEFLLTPGKSEIDTRNEAKALTEFTKKNLSDQTEVRFVLGASMRSPENIVTMCKGLLGVRTPSMIRTDIQLKLQVSKANSDEHNKQISIIKESIKAPIKLSGNIVSIKSIAASPQASKFAVNLTQARTIIKEFQSQPDQLRELLDAE